MLISVGIVLIAVFIVIIEAPNLKRTKSRKERWLFFVLLLIGVVLGVLQSFQINIPNPMNGIAFIYRPLSDVIFGWLG